MEFRTINKEFGHVYSLGSNTHLMMFGLVGMGEIAHIEK